MKAKIPDTGTKVLIGHYQGSKYKITSLVNRIDVQSNEKDLISSNFLINAIKKIAKVKKIRKISPYWIIIEIDADNTKSKRTFARIQNNITIVIDYHIANMLNHKLPFLSEYKTTFYL